MLVRFIGYLFAATVIVGLSGAAAVAYVVWYVSQDLPNYDALAKYEPPVTTRLHAADGRLLAEYARERRLYLPIDTIPDLVIHAFLSAEDKNFYEHSGLDYQGIIRAVFTNINNLRAGRRPVGASTITQQVAKNFLLSSEISYERKLKEALLAMKIERAYSKDQILELYLNEIYLGFGTYGVAAASLIYFDKSVGELTLPEAAYLAALPKAPNNYHPYRFPDRAVERRNWVIDRMIENGHVSVEEGEAAKESPIEVTLRPPGAHSFAADYFAEAVRRKIYAMYGEEKLYEGGLSVRTTLDPKLQVMARKALVGGLVAFDRERGWRGPVTHIELGEDWGAPLGGVEALAGIAPWRLAMVLSADKEKAVLGLQPPRDPSGELSSARATIELPLGGVEWARAAQEGGGLGKKVTAVDAVLSVGDVVYVAPAEPKADPEARDKDKEASPGWELMQVPEVEGAIVVMDPHTGRVNALVGGFSYAESEFNRATQALRQPGSAFKPIVYSAALDNGYTPSSVVLDAPIEIDPGAGQDVWKPQNYGGDFYGPSTLRLGVEKSRNVMTVRLAQDMGMPLIAEYARRFGVYDGLLPVLAMALGAGETTVLKLTAAYAMIDNGGRQITPTLIDRIQDRWGRTIYRHDDRVCNDCDADSWHNQDEPQLPDNRLQIVDPKTAYQVTSILEGVVQRGTGTTVKAVGKPLAGKTGTTNDERDAWFVGFSPDLVAGVFVGYDTPRPMGRGATGGHVAAPIFRDFMKMALADKPAVPFRVPPGIEMYRINAQTGLMARPGDEKVIMEAFKPGTHPPDSTAIIGYSDDQGRALTVDPAADRAVSSGTGGLY
ncbi:MAG: penicillin-binding protein 1A [Hyphomicrobiales bacterium]|nr:penicillin-binding protein 1A [Hyphomicrobiales bacterium]